MYEVGGGDAQFSWKVDEVDFDNGVRKLAPFFVAETYFELLDRGINS